MCQGNAFVSTLDIILARFDEILRIPQMIDSKYSFLFRSTQETHIDMEA